MDKLYLNSTFYIKNTNRYVWELKWLVYTINRIKECECIIMSTKSNKIIVSAIVVIMIFIGFIAYKMSINNKPVEGLKQYTVIVTDTSNTFHDEFTIKTEETSFGKDLDKKDLIEFEKGPYGRFVTGVHGKKADESKREWWEIILNGESSSKAIDDIIIHDGDEIRFVLTTGW